MIREISGTVLSIDLLGLTVDVGGWGVFVHTADTGAYSIDTEIRLKTYLSVTQSGIDLYGFSTEEDRAFFELLLSVSGIGPKTALGYLRRAERSVLAGAIAKRDVEYLTRVIGLGKKAAEKLSVELSEKIAVGERTPDDSDAEVFDTLVALGYTEREARSALTRVGTDIIGKDARLKAALSQGR